MLRGRDKDIDALREGIREEVRREIHLADSKAIMEKIFRRQYIDEVDVFYAEDLQVGDVLVGSDDGTTFYRKAIVKYVGTSTPDGKPSARDLWVEYSGEDVGTSGSGGTALRRDQLVLLERNA